MRARRGWSGQVDHLAPEPGGAVRLVPVEARPARRAASRASARARAGGGSRNGSAAGVGAPDGQLERQPGQVGMADLGVGERPARRMLDLRPQPHGHARARGARPGRPAGRPTPSRRARSRDGSARCRRRTRAAGPGRRRPRSTRPRPSGWSRRCRWPARPCAGRAGRARGRRPARRRAAPRRAGGRRRASAATASRSSVAVRRISPAPGRNTSTSPSGSARSTARTAPTTAGSRCWRGRRGSPPDVDRVGPALAASRPAPASAVAAEQRRHAARRRAWPTSRGCAGRGAGAGGRRGRGRGRGRPAGCARGTRRRSTSPTPSSAGSRCRRRVRMPSVTTSMRVAGPTARSSRVR